MQTIDFSRTIVNSKMFDITSLTDFFYSDRTNNYSYIIVILTNTELGSCNKMYL